MTIHRSELEPLVQAWHASADATQQPQVQAMIREETGRIHRAFAQLPIQVQFVDFDPYDSFEQMRDQVQSSGTMLVWTGASETPLWDPQTNWMARAVHDWDHIVKSCDFSMEGEAAAARAAAQCRPGLAPIYLSEVMLQAAIKNYSGEFVEQKLVVLPEPLQRYAINLRGLRGTRNMGAIIKQYFASERAYHVLDASQELAGGTWVAGGCWVGALALQRVLPGSELWVLTSHGTPQHVVVAYQGSFFDADGASSRAQLLRRWRDVEGLSELQLVPWAGAAWLEHAGLVCPIDVVATVANDLQQVLRRGGLGAVVGAPTTALPEVVWTVAGILRASDEQAAMVHLAAMGFDPSTSLVLVDAARMLNAQVDSERVSAAEEESLGPRLGAAYPVEGETLVLAGGKRRTRRTQCAADKLEYAWLRVNPCMETQPGVEADPITNSQALADFIQKSVPIEHQNRESVLVIGVDNKNRPMGIHVAHIGGRSTAMVDPTVVMQAMLLLGASSFFVAHNHPSGMPEPSPEDRALTERLVGAGNLVSLPLLDHLVIGRNSYSSFRDLGLL